MTNPPRRLGRQAALLLFLLAGCALVPSSHDITVTLDLTGSVRKTPEGCTGSLGYSDIEQGTQFTIKDPSGKLIGFGSLTSSRFIDSRHCTFSGKAQDVPGAAIYSVEIGRRGVVNFTAAELEANAWTAGLTLGD